MRRIHYYLLMKVSRPATLLFFLAIVLNDLIALCIIF